MLGSIIGDIAGSRFEFNNHRSKEFDLFSKHCFATDDSIMTLAIAKAILTCAGNWEQLGEYAVKYMQTIGRKYPDCGYGGMFYNWVFGDDPKPYNSFGNGAAMRVSPCGFIANIEDEAKLLSKKVTEVSHNHPEGLKGAEATAVAIFMARNGAIKSEIKKRIEKDYYSLDFTIDNIRESYQFNETCQETVPQAIKAFLESISFEDAIRNAISIGGDSDTLAAITGGIAEAYYGIPHDLKKEALPFLDRELRDIYKEWDKLIRRTYPVRKFTYITKYINKLNSQEQIYEFFYEFYCFLDTCPEYELNNYSEILEKNNLKWEAASMRSADVKNLDEQCILALITGAFRADHFAEGVLDEFIKDGSIDNWLTRLKTLDDAHQVEEEKPLLKQARISLYRTRSNAKSELFITNRQAVIKFSAQDGGYVTHQYEFGEETEYGEQSLSKMRECLDAAGWNDRQDFNKTDFIGHLYKLEAEYEDGKIVTHHGAFDRVHIPEKALSTFIDTIRLITNTYGFGEIINLDGFMSVVKPGEVKYCGVEFSDSGRIYHYRTTDARIKAGDKVIVPVGDDSYRKEVTVKTIEFCRWDNTPYPLEKTKEIIGLVDDKESDISSIHISRKKAGRHLPYETFVSSNDDDEESYE